MNSGLIIAGIVVATLVVLGLIAMRLYRRSTKETTYVRTGFGGMKVIMDGGALVFPVLHEIMPVNMNTMALVIDKKGADSLRTKDKLRVDVKAEFYIRVKPDKDAIGTAAQTLGRRTQSPGDLSNLVQGKLEDALRSVAAQMEMEQLNTNRANFVQEVQKIAAAELSMNGLELESVALTGMNQTDRSHFDENNAFDAEGLAFLTKQIQQRRRERNDVEQGTEVAIAERNRAANLEQLEIRRKDQEATLAQQQEVAFMTATQAAEIAKREAEQQQLSETARIASERAVQVAEQERLQAVEVAEIAKDRGIKEAAIAREQAVQLAEQKRQIAVANASRDQSKAVAEAKAAEATAVEAEQQVVTVRATAEADRTKAIAVIAATQEAEVAATGITVAAAAKRRAAEDEAEAARELAKGAADAKITEAEAEKTAALLAAEAQEKTYVVEAEGQERLNNAANRLDDKVLRQRISLATIEALPAVIAASVKPMEQIDKINIIEVGGLTNGASFGPGGERLITGGSGNLAEDAVQAALRYRAQGPMVDMLIGQVFGDGKTLETLLTGATRPTAVPAE